MPSARRRAFVEEREESKRGVHEVIGDAAELKRERSECGNVPPECDVDLPE